MNAIKGFLAVSSVAFCGLALGGLIVGASGCAEPGVVQVAPTGKNVNKKDAGTPPKKDAGKAPVQQEEDDATADDVADEDKPTDEEDDKETPPTASKDAGKAGVDAGGGKADAGVTKPGADAGKETGGTGEVAACPSGYMCQDPAGPLSEMGLEGEITFQDGTPVTASCAKGGMETCDLKDPKKSCPNFKDPVCIHVKITGLLAIDFQQCGQKCTP